MPATMYRNGRVYVRDEKSGEWVESTYLAVALQLEDGRDELRHAAEIAAALSKSARTAGWGV